VIVPPQNSDGDVHIIVDIEFDCSNTQQEELPITMEYTRAWTGPRIDTTQEEEERPVTKGYTSAWTGPYTDIQHKKNDPSVWDTLVHERDRT
jgi:hypothetical protein